MEAYYHWLNSLVNQTKSEFSGLNGISWLNHYKSNGLEEKRRQLLLTFENQMLFKDTKPFYNHLSRGCEICGAGKWSCLFITGKCNANCFYCPSSQLKDEPPSTQSLTFPDPRDYAAYINRIGFKGVSFSGGEPLLFFDRTLRYLEEIRRKCSPDLYIWMYTNGILADQEKLKKLARRGLNEVRFDIGATAFSLDRLKIAKNIIPAVTIEIPAIPEEKEKIIRLLPEMEKAGVKNLNLHQMRLTHHNAARLLKRKYTLLPAEKPVVVESELTALEIMNYAKNHDINIGINYCSFFFKNRFQQSGFRKLLGSTLVNGDRPITENGFIREFGNKDISYKECRIQDKNDRQDSRAIDLETRSVYFCEERLMKKSALSDPELQTAIKLFSGEPQSIPEDPFGFRIWQMEYIESGLRM
ncbi:MAG: radical SAM protein [Bacteroidota bacterium]